MAAPTTLRVLSFSGTLSGPQKEMIVKFMLAAYGGSELDRIIYYGLGERRVNFVPDGPFGKVCRDVLEWVIQTEDKLVPLLNGFIDTRSGRSDLRPMLQKLHDEGVIVLKDK
jgi:hypothetical protein